MAIKTYEELVAWIETNVPKEKLGSEDAQKAAMWWAAWQEALALRNMSMRELAHLCQDGMPAVTKEHITEQLTPDEDDEDYDPEDLEAELRDWFELEEA